MPKRTVRSDLAEAFGPYWRLTVVDAPGGGDPAPIPSDWRCGACGGPALRSVGSGAGGGIAGGELWHEVRCEACGAVTEYRHEWG